MSNRPKVFFVVTIPTHLRVLMDAADLVHATGRYIPIMVYHPSAVFDQNYADCKNKPYPAYVWYNNSFHASGATCKNSSIKPIPTAKLKRNFWSSGSGRYLKIRKSIRFLPSPSAIGTAVSIFYPAVRLAVSFYGFARGLFKIFFFSESLNTSSNSDTISLHNKSWLQRFLIRTFATEWISLSHDGLQPQAGFHLRLRKLFREGLFSGLTDQRIFYDEFYKLINTQNPVLVVLPEANFFYYSHYVIRAAHLNSIPIVIVPFTIVNTLEWAEAFFDIALYQANSGWNRLFSIAFPHWVLKHRGRRLILPPSYILACEYLNMVPDIPWLINSGNIDAIAAESQFMANYYLRSGISAEKIQFTGALSDDSLYSLLSERDQHLRTLGASFNILIKGKVILIGLPPDQFGGGKRKGCEFDNHEDLIRFMISMITLLSNCEHTVLINLHPRINPADVVWLTEFGATIINEPIERLVPLADIYVAVASATIRLGISCSIPVVNYDAYQYDYDDYKGLSGVCEVKTKHEYELILDSLIHDPLFYSKTQTAQKVTANNLCLVDGNAGKRLLSLFDELVLHGTVA